MPAMNWKPGDVAVVIKGISPSVLIGKTCEIVAVHINCRIQITVNSKAERWPVVVEIKIDGVHAPYPFSGIGVKPEWLRRPNEGYDGNQLATWDRCLFKPKRMIDLASELELFSSAFSNIKKLENLKWP
jgi:hypothetical protein